MPIAPLPAAPDVGDRANFAAEATAWAADLPRWTNEVNAMAEAFGPGAPFCTASGTNAVVLTSGYGINALEDGQSVGWEATATNTGAVTINLDGLGARSVVTFAGAALPGGYIRVGEKQAAVFDASANRWEIAPPIGSDGALPISDNHKLATVEAVRDFARNRTALQLIGETVISGSPSAVIRTFDPSLYHMIEVELYDVKPSTAGQQIAFRLGGSDGVLFSGASDYDRVFHRLPGGNIGSGIANMIPLNGDDPQGTGNAPGEGLSGTIKIHGVSYADRSRIEAITNFTDTAPSQSSAVTIGVCGPPFPNASVGILATSGTLASGRMVVWGRRK